MTLLVAGLLLTASAMAHAGLNGKPMLHGRAASRCDVAGVYRELEAPTGTLAKTTSGTLEEVEMVIAPTRLETGAYEVSVTRKAKDLYREDLTGIYIVTRYCYEYTYSQRAVLRYTSLGRSGTGSLVFE